MDNGESSLRRYMGGDNEAFGEIVETYYRGLVMFAMRLRRSFRADDKAGEI